MDEEDDDSGETTAKRGPFPGARTCPSCHRPTASIARLCVHCGRDLGSPTHQDEDEGDDALRARRIECPGCDAPTTEVTLGRVTFDVCSNCGGAWFDRGELDRVVSRLSDEDVVEQARQVLGLAGIHDLEDHRAKDEAAATALSPVRYVHCPLCRRLLDRRNYREASGIILDLCNAHGAWLDHQDLRQLVDLVAAGRIDALAQRVERMREFERTRPRLPASSDRPLTPLASSRSRWGLDDLVFNLFASLFL